MQVVKTPMTGGENFVYLKEIYITSNYFIEISKNITKINNSNYNIKINVINRGQAKTTPNQFVVIYNFIPNEFSLISPFIYSQSDWYLTDETNQTLLKKTRST